MSKNFRKTSEKFTEFYEKLPRILAKNPKGNSIFHETVSIFCRKIAHHI